MKRIGIIGVGRFGQALVGSLAKRGAETLIIDQSRETVQNYADIATKAVQGDATNSRSLAEAGFNSCDVAVVCIGHNTEGSIMATVNCKELGIPLVVAKATTELHGKVLKRVGADIVIYPDRDRAQRLARSLLSKSPIDLFEIIDGLSIAEISPPHDLIGKTIIEGDVRQKHNVTVLAIRRQAEDSRLPRSVLVVEGTETVHKTDLLIVFGSVGSIEKLSHA